MIETKTIKSHRCMMRGDVTPDERKTRGNLVVQRKKHIFAPEFSNRIVMCRIVNQQTTHVKTQDGIILARRITTVRMPNGTSRFPVVYYDVTPNVVKVSSEELKRLRVPTYKQLI